MQRFFVVALSVLAGFVFAFLLLAGSLAVQAGTEENASQNGDVNADGQIDIADAVYTLQHLFKGGPGPVPCAAPPDLAAKITELEAAISTCQTDLAASGENAAALSVQVQQLQAELARCRGRSGLPDTGQTRCHNSEGVRIPCDSSTYPGQDAAYATGCPMEGRFTDNGDGTVTDQCTGLMWQKNTTDVNGDGQSTDRDSLPWWDALTYCDGLSFAGHDDWRLPNVRELQSIVDYGRAEPCTDPVFGTLSSVYWSSSFYANSSNPGGAWAITFDVGDVSRTNVEVYDFYVRAVRGP